MTKSFPIWIVIILLLATLLRFSTLGRNSLWFDEAWGVYRAHQPVKVTLAGTTTLGEDEVGRPPLFYASLHYWVNWFGDSETAVRMPSAIASLLCVGLVYLLGRQISSRQVALVAMSLLAFSPLHVWYGQEVRMYIFVTCLGLIAANGLAWDHWLTIIPTSLALAAGLYTDFPMIPLWVAISAMFMVYWWVNGRSLKSILIWAASTSLALLLYQPWWSRALHLFNLLDKIHFFSSTREILGLPSFTGIQYILLLTFVGFGFTIGFWVIYKSLATANPRKILTPFILIGFLLLTIAFVYPRMFGLKRVIATGWPYACLLVAWLIVSWERKQKLIWYGLMSVSVVASLLMIWWVPKDDWRNAVAYINKNANVGDIVWINPSWNQFVYDYYDETHPAYSGTPEQLSNQITGDVWIVAERFPGQAIPSSPNEAWLDAQLHLVERVPYYRLEVRHYRPDE